MAVAAAAYSERKSCVALFPAYTSTKSISGGENLGENPHSGERTNERTGKRRERARVPCSPMAAHYPAQQGRQRRRRRVGGMGKRISAARRGQALRAFSSSLASLRFLSSSLSPAVVGGRRFFIRRRSLAFSRLAYSRGEFFFFFCSVRDGASVTAVSGGDGGLGLEALDSGVRARASA